jgi:hypothetical protein
MREVENAAATSEVRHGVWMRIGDMEMSRE